MTDEQIKQNAIKAAADFKDWHHPQMSFYDGYIAGAHSRDEEVFTFSEASKIKDKHILRLLKENKNLKKELDKLRNPWISVKDRLPEKEVDNISIPVVAITNNRYWFKGQYDYDNKEWFFSEDPDCLDFEIDEFVTHWMPISELKKGE